jgi:hypothetical protein
VPRLVQVLVTVDDHHETAIFRLTAAVVNRRCCTKG